MAFFGTKEKCFSLDLKGLNPKISKPKIKPLPSAFRQKNWANPTFLWAANRDSAKVVKKIVKSEAKSPEMGQNFKTLYLWLGMAELRTLKF